jgi:predicted phosphodiesterase
MKQKQVVTVDFISDLHLGSNDAAFWPAIESYIGFAAVHPPDIRVWGGDILDLESCSMHGGNPEPEIMSDDVTAALQGIDHILSWDGTKIRNIWVEGNHENRFKRLLTKQVPALVGALPTLEALLDLEARGFELPGKSWTFQNVLFTHGHVAGKHPAARMLELHPNVDAVVFGHVHKPQTSWAPRPNYTAPKPTKPEFHTQRGRIAIANGCMRTLDPSWLASPGNWAHGFTRLWFFETGFTFCQYLMHGPRCEFFAEGDLWHSEALL